MFRSLEIKGTEGEIRWVYHRAARLGLWSLSAQGATGTLTAKVLESDAFKLEQPGLVFRVCRPNGSWTYPILSLHIADGTLYASLDLQG